MSEYGGTLDPLMPLSSRFPLSPSGGRITPSPALPSGFLRSPGGIELFGHGTDGSWVTAGLHPDGHGLYPLAQGGPQRLWDTVESCHASWRRLGEPDLEQFGVTAQDDIALQYVWFDSPDSAYRWPLPL